VTTTILPLVKVFLLVTAVVMFLIFLFFAATRRRITFALALEVVLV
jgi:hypothetical protein